MTGQWRHEWPKKAGVYWTVAPGGTEPTFVEIRGERWQYMERDYELDAPTMFWSEPLKAPPPPDGFRLASADHATWTQLWPANDGMYWLSHPNRPVMLAQVTRDFRGIVGGEDAWERGYTITGELFWDAPVVPPALPDAFIQ